MDALEIAKTVANQAVSMLADDGATTKTSMQLGLLHAAIAQAEQSKRIADALKSLLRMAQEGE